MSNQKRIRTTFEQNNGIFRLAPAWVPRSFCIPGRRIKLHPDDYYALGGERGGIDNAGSAAPLQLTTDLSPAKMKASAIWSQMTAHLSH